MFTMVWLWYVIVRVHPVHLMNVELIPSWPTIRPSQPTCAVRPPGSCYCLHPLFLFCITQLEGCIESRRLSRPRHYNLNPNTLSHIHIQPTRIYGLANTHKVRGRQNLRHRCWFGNKSFTTWSTISRHLLNTRFYRASAYCCWRAILI